MKLYVSMKKDVGQASRLPSERARASAKENLSSASPNGAGETPALLYHRLGSVQQHATKLCRETLSVNLPSESGSKLHALQTLARSCCGLLFREAFGVRPACRRFAFRSPKGELLRGILSLPLVLAAALAIFTHTAFAQTWQTVNDFQYLAGQSAANTALARMTNGTLLAAGYGYDTARFSHALVMSSADGGVTWSAPVDDFTGSTSGDDPWYSAVGSDSAGNLYAAGIYTDQSHHRHAAVFPVKPVTKRISQWKLA